VLCVKSKQAKATAHGWCAKHYMRARRHGDPAIVLPTGRKPAPVGLIERLPPRRHRGKLLMFGFYGGKCDHLSWLLPLCGHGLHI
jgi:hypothetical protein